MFFCKKWQLLKYEFDQLSFEQFWFDKWTPSQIWKPKLKLILIKVFLNFCETAKINIPKKKVLNSSSEKLKIVSLKFFTSFCFQRFFQNSISDTKHILNEFFMVLEKAFFSGFTFCFCFIFSLFDSFWASYFGYDFLNLTKLILTIFLSVCPQLFQSLFLYIFISINCTYISSFNHSFLLSYLWNLFFLLLITIVSVFLTDESVKICNYNLKNTHFSITWQPSPSTMYYNKRQY